MKAFFAGSFDPFTIGHLDIVNRGLNIFDSITIAIGINENKPSEWSVNSRLEAIRILFKDKNNIEVISYKGLTVAAAQENGADVLLRGVRSSIDFEYERNLADVNKKISGLDTVILIADPSLEFVSSSMVRELIHNNFDVSQYIAGPFPRKN